MTTRTAREILDIIQRTLDPGGPPLTMDSTADDVPGWDSLGQINIIVALDQALGSAVSEIPEMATAHSVRGILALLRGAGLVSGA